MYTYLQRIQLVITWLPGLEPWGGLLRGLKNHPGVPILGAKHWTGILNLGGQVNSVASVSLDYASFVEYLPCAVCHAGRREIMVQRFVVFISSFL